MQWERGWYKRRLPYIGTPPVPGPPHSLVLPPHVSTPPVPSRLTRGSAIFVRPPLKQPAVAAASVPRLLVVRPSVTWHSAEFFKGGPVFSGPVSPKVLPPLVARRDSRRRGQAIFIRPPLKAPVITTRTVPPPLVVRRDFYRRGTATFTRPPLPGRVGTKILPPVVVRPDLRRRDSVTFTRPPLRAPATSAGGVLPPFVSRRDFHRRGVSIFTRPPTPPKVGAKIFRPLVVRADFSRRGVVYFVRNLAAKVNVAGGVIRPIVYRAPLPVRLTRGSVFTTHLFSVGTLTPPFVNLPADWTEPARPTVWVEPARPTVWVEPARPATWIARP